MDQIEQIQSQYRHLTHQQVVDMLARSPEENLMQMYPHLSKKDCADILNRSQADQLAQIYPHLSGDDIANLVIIQDDLKRPKEKKTTKK